jgi:serine/threonine protein kinase
MERGRVGAKDESVTTTTVEGRSDVSGAFDESQRFVQPTRLGRFVLMHELGAGGMGTVFAAYDERLDRKVALKILSQSQNGGPLLRAQIIREARAAGRISHPNVIAIYEVGESDDQIYIAMEFVDGSTLYKWQQAGGHGWQETLAMYLQVGEALVAAHAAKVVHRYFKPDNVLLGEDGRPRVVDFGLARVGFSSEEELEPTPEPVALTPEEGNPAYVSGRLTLPGVISGTPGYMSPEQYRGGNVDSRSDQWSFCAALFEALYGFLPFSGETVNEYRRSLFHPPRPRPGTTEVPVEVHQVLLRGLSIEPDQRFESMQELVAALSREQRGDAAAGTFSRKRLSLALLIVAALSVGFAQLRQLSRQLTHRETLIPSILVVTTLIIGGFVYRRTLRASRFHRHVFVVIAATTGMNFLQRIVGTILDLPMNWQFPFEMIVMAGGAAILSTTLIRSVFFVPLVPLLAGVVQLLGWLPTRALSITYLTVVVALVIGWSRASEDEKQEGGFGGPSPGPFSPRRPTPSSTRRRPSRARSNPAS